MNLETREGHGLADVVQKPTRDRLGVPHARNFGQDDDELIACKPRQRIRPTQPIQKPPSRLLQQLIPRQVSQRVVDGLEPIQVHDHHGKAPLAPFALRNGLFQAVGQQNAVRQACQGVMRRDVLQLGVGTLELLVVAAGL